MGAIYSRTVLGAMGVLRGYDSASMGQPAAAAAPIAFLSVEGGATAAGGGGGGACRIVTMSADRSIGVHRFIRPPPSGKPQNLHPKPYRLDHKPQTTTINHKP
jgi:hypothetical protein